MTRSYSEEPKYSFCKRICNILPMILLLVISPNLSFAQCSGTVYDPGGSGSNYPNNSSVTTTYTAPVGSNMKITFTSFNIESGYDFFKIYDGPSTASTQIANLTGSSISQTVYTSSSNALTIRFTSDNIITAPGYSFTLSCVIPVPACASNALTNGDFDNGSTGWSLSGAAVISSATNDKVDGAGGLKLDDPSDKAEQNISAFPGQTIDVSFFGKTTSSGGNALVKLQYFNSGNTLISESSESITNSGSFALYNLSGIVPSGTASVKLVALRDGSTSANAYFDEICAEVSGTVPPNTVEAVNDINNTAANTPVNGDVLANDIDPQGDNLTVNTTPIADPTNGTVVLNADGTYTYTPDMNFVGNDSFQYEVCDDGTPSVCDTATVNVTVTQGGATDCANNTNIAQYEGFGIVGTTTADLYGWTDLSGAPTLLQAYALGGYPANHLATDYVRDRLIFSLDGAQSDMFAYNFSTGTVTTIGSGILSSLGNSTGGAVFYNGEYYIFDDNYDGAVAEVGLFKVTFDAIGNAATLTEVAEVGILNDLTLPNGQGDIAIDTDGTLYALESITPGLSANGELWSIDLNAATPTWSLIGDPNLPATSQLFIDNLGRLIANEGAGDFVELSKTTGQIIDDTFDMSGSNTAWSDLSEGGQVISCPPVVDGCTVDNTNIAQYEGFGVVGTTSADLYGFTDLSAAPILLQSNALGGYPANHLATDYARDRLIFSLDGAQSDMFAYNFSTGTVSTIGSGILSSLGNSTGGAVFYNGEYYIFDDNYDGATSEVGLFKVTFDVFGNAATITEVAEVGIQFDTTLPNGQGDIAIDTDGILYALESNTPGTSANAELWKIDLNAVTPTWSLVGNTGLPGFSQLFIDNAGRLIANEGAGDFVELSKTTGQIIDNTFDMSGSNTAWSDLSEGGQVISCPPVIEPCTVDNTNIAQYEGFGVVGFTSADLYGFTDLSAAPTLLQANALGGYPANHLATDYTRDRLIFSYDGAQSHLFAYNFSTGTVTTIGSGTLSGLGNSTGGAVFYNGEYYIFDDNYDGATLEVGLFKVTFDVFGNAATITEVAEVGIQFDTTLPNGQGDIAIDTDGILYALESNTPGTSANAELWKIDLNAVTPSWSLVGNTGLPGFSQLFIDNLGRLIANEGAGDFVELSKTTGQIIDDTFDMSGSNTAWSDLSEGGQVIPLECVADCTSGLTAAEICELCNTTDGTNQGNALCALDCDMDGLTNAEECDGGTDPRGPQCPSSSTSLPNITFDMAPDGSSIPAGADPSEIWSALGIHITTHDPSNYPPRIVDSSNPPSGDPDLGSPNTDFGGPGQGSGGGSGEIGENNTALGNVIIVNDGNGGLNDYWAGGSIIIDFDNPTDFASLEILDFDHYNIDGLVTAYNNNGEILRSLPIYALGDNSYQKVVIDTNQVSQIVIEANNSFSLASLLACDDEIPTGIIGDFVYFDTNNDGMPAGEDGIENIQVSLYDNDNNLLSRMNTDSAGYYSFNNLPAGEYEVEIELPTNFYVTDDLDGDFNNSSGIFTIIEGQHKDDVDFGIRMDEICDNGVDDDGDDLVDCLDPDCTDGLVNISEDDSICEGEIATISASGGASYNWDNGLGAGASHDVNPSTTTTYTVTVTSSFGCQVTDFVTVNVNPELSLAVDFIGQICLEDDSKLSTINTGGTAPFTYNWKDPSNNTLISDTIEVEESGNYYVTVTDAQGCSDDIAAFVYESYEPFVSTLGTTVCEGESIDLSISTPATAFLWGANAGNATTSSVTVTPSPPSTTYTVTVTNTQGCTAETSATINADPKPVVNYTGLKTVCEGLNTQLTPTSGGTWTSSNTNVAEINSSGLVTTKAAGKVVFTFKNDLTDCVSNPSDTLTVLPKPLVSVTGANVICADAQTLLSPTSGGTWTSSDNTIAEVTNAGLVTGKSNGVVTFTFTNDATGCVSDLTESITINERPIAVLEGSNILCEEDNTTITPNTGGTWTSSKTNIVTVTNTGLVTAINSGTAKLIFENTATGCQTDSIQIDVIGKPNLSFTGPTAICEGFTTGLASSQGGAWRNLTPSIISLQSNGSITGLMPGIAKVVFDGSNGCISDTAEITINEIFTPSLNGVDSICIGSTTLLSPSSGGAWVSSDDNIATVTDMGLVTGVSEGAVTFTFTSDEGCVSLPSNQLAVDKNGSISISGDNVLCLGQTTALEASQGGGTWSSSDLSVATVNSTTGVVTAVGIGSVNIVYNRNSSACFVDPLFSIEVFDNPTITQNGNSQVCMGESIFFTTNITNGVWQSSNESVATISTNGVITTIAPGTATFTVMHPTTGCSSVPSATITINPAVDLAIDFNGSVCLTDDSKLTALATGGTIDYDFSWSGPNGFSSTLQTIDIDTNGNYYVTVTDSKGCTDETSAFVYQRYDVNILSLNTEVCEDDDVTLSVSDAPGQSYLWSANAGNATTNEVTVIPTLPSSRYDVTITNYEGCAISTFVDISVKAKPSVSITGPDNICEGEQTSLSPTTGGFWISNNNAIASVSNNGNVLGITSGSTTFTFQDTASQCISDPTALITVDDKVVVNISGPTELCEVGSATLIADVASGKWYSSNTGIATIDSITGEITPNALGSTVITYVIAGANCYDIGVFNVSVINTPTVSFTGPTQVCEGLTTNLSPISGGTWVSSDTTVAKVTDQGVVTAVGAGSALFTFTSDQGCVGELLTPIVVTPDAPVSLTGAPGICQGYTSSLSPTSGGVWVSNNNLIASVTANGVVFGNNEGKATFTFYESTNGCPSQETIDIEVFGKPTIDLGSPGDICVGSETAITPNTGGTWESNNESVATILDNGTITAVGAGEARFTFTDTITGCKSDLSEKLTVIDLPTINLGSTSDICIGSTISVSPTTGGTWTSSNPTVASVVDGVMTAYNTGTVTFTFLSNNGGCNSAESQPITVGERPTISFDGGQAICIGSTTKLTASEPGIWGSSDNSIASISADGTISGIFPGIAKFIFTTADGICSSDSSDAVQVLPKPTISLQGDSELCIGSTTTFIPNVGGEWTSSNPGVAEINNAGVVLAKSQGVAQFTYTNSSTNCTSNASIPITVYDAPIVLVTGGDSICIGSNTTLSPSSGGVWTSSDFSKAIVSSTGLVTGISPGEVTFTFTNNSNSCSADLAKPITVMPNPVVSIDGPVSICEGETTTLSPNTGGQWASTNPTVATVNAQGVVQGLSQGIAKFVFTSDKGCSSVETGAIIVIGNPNPVFIGNPDVCIGGQMNILPNTGGSWASSDENIATITDGGLITGLQEGTVQFTFTDTINGCVSDPSGDFSVNGKPVISVPNDKIICIGESFSVAPTGGGTWYSTNPEIAQINNSGTVLGLSAGTTRFYYQTFNTGCTSDTSALVTVEAIGDPQLNGPATICVGDTTYFLPSTTGSWVSTNDNIATISNTGVVVGKSGGIVRFKYINGAGCESNMSVPITVYDAPVVGLLGSPFICEGSTTTVYPSSGGVWMSSDTSIAEVTNNGLVIGKNPGSVNLIYIDNVSGCSSDGNLEVVVQLPPVITNLGSSDVCVDYSTLLTSGEQGLWVSSDDRIATVDATGLVTAWTPGKVLISFISTATGCEAEAVELNITKCTNHDFDVTLLNTVVEGDLSTNDIGPVNAVYSSSTILISKPTASNDLLAINNDGTYSFTGDKPGKYIYEVQICTPPNIFGCPTTVLEITVVANQFTDNTPVSNLEFTTTFGNALITLPGDEVVLEALSNDRCVRSGGCNLDLSKTVISSSALDGIDSYDDNGNVTYTPNIGKIGRDELAYTVCTDELSSNCSTSKLYVTIASPTADNSIVASDDFESTISTSVVTANVTDNDSDPEGDLISVVAQGSAATPITITGGTYFIDATGAYTFTPDASFNGPTSFIYTVCDDNAEQSCMDATVHLLIFGDVVNVNIRVYLEGAIMGNEGAVSSTTGRPLMRDDLRSNSFQGGNNIIPINDPYSSGVGLFQYGKKTHVGPGLLSKNQVIADSLAVFSVTGDNAIVDWVYLEIRNKNDHSDCIATRSALLQRDGDVVDLDGVSPVSFQSIGVDSFYVVVKHRNHLGAMSGLVSNTDFVDFTDPETEVFNYGVHPTIGFDYSGLTFNTKTLTEYNCLWAGDANSDGQITFEGGGDIDVNVIQVEVLLFGGNIELSSNYDFVHGYYNGDYDMNGKVKFTNPSDDTNMLFSQVLLYDLNVSLSSIFVGFIEQVPERSE